MRFYMVLVRDYDRADPLETWKPWVPRSGRMAALYDSPKSAKSGIGTARQGRSYDASTGFTYFKKDTRIVYFDSEDLIDFTDDADLLYQQNEAKMLRAGDAADAAKALALNPPVPIAPAPKKPRKKKVKAVLDVETHPVQPGVMQPQPLSASYNAGYATGCLECGSDTHSYCARD